MANYIRACLRAAFNPCNTADEYSWSRAKRAASALWSPSKNNRHFPGDLPPALVISFLTDSPEILYEPFYQILPSCFNLSKTPSSQNPFHLIILYHLPHLLGVPSPWLRQLINPTSKQSKSYCWSCCCRAKNLFYPTILSTMSFPFFFS